MSKESIFLVDVHFHGSNVFMNKLNGKHPSFKDRSFCFHGAGHSYSVMKGPGGEEERQELIGWSVV